MRIIVDYDGAIGYAEEVPSPIEGEDNYYRIMFLDDVIPVGHQLREGIETGFGYLVMNTPSLQEKGIEILRPDQKYVDLWRTFQELINGELDSRIRLHIKDTFFPLLMASGAVEEMEIKSQNVSTKDVYQIEIRFYPTIDGMGYELHSAEEMDRALPMGSMKMISSSFPYVYWNNDDEVGKTPPERR
jgi:hypothetical protein